MIKKIKVKKQVEGWVKKGRIKELTKFGFSQIGDSWHYKIFHITDLQLCTYDFKEWTDMVNKINNYKKSYDNGSQYIYK